jgi:pimeloyl-ACP methyl ester carboxylesterase
MKKIFMFFFSLTLLAFNANGQKVRTSPAGEISRTLGTPTNLEATTPVDFTPKDGGEVIPTDDDGPVDNGGGGGGSTSSGNRQIVWLHGLEGSTNSWHHYDEKTVAERQVGKTFRPAYAGYGTNDPRNATTIPDGADKVMATLANNPLFNASPNNIFIGHSMGGLVLRSIDKKRTEANLNPYYGGFITFGTPNKGAKIADNIQVALDFLRDGVTKLKKGPQSTPRISGALAAFSCIVSGDFPFHTNRCKSIIDMLNEFEGSINGGLGFATGPSKDLGSNSPFIADLNSFSHTKPSIVVAGDEDGPTLWREASSLDGDNAPSNLPLNQVNDGVLGKAMEKLIGVYGDVTWYLDSWIGRRLTTDAGAKHAAWTEGKLWAQNAPTQWEFLNGSMVSGTREVTRYGLLPGLQSAFESWRNNCRSQSCTMADFIRINSIPNGGYTTYIDVVPAIYRSANDGLIPIASAHGLPNAAKITVQGVNHQEMMNHPEVTKAFDNKIYNKLNGDFFGLLRRQ